MRYGGTIGCVAHTHAPIDILKLSDETDLDLLNNAMETMVKHYTAELLPVAAQLTARLVSNFIPVYLRSY